MKPLALLLLLTLPAQAQWVAYDASVICEPMQCWGGSCQPQYAQPQPIQQNFPGTQDRPQFVPRPEPLEPPQPAPTTNSGANVLILASLAKIEQRLTVIESKQGEPGPAGPQGERGAAGPAGSNADLSFKIRVRNPRTGYTTPFAEVKNHGEVTLILDPAQLGEK